MKTEEPEARLPEPRPGFLLIPAIPVIGDPAPVIPVIPPPTAVIPVIPVIPPPVIPGDPAPGDPAPE